MVCSLVVWLALTPFGIVFSQEPATSEDELRARYEEKLKKDFLKEVKWQRSIKKARKLAKRKKKPILAYFSRSYAP